MGGDHFHFSFKVCLCVDVHNSSSPVLPIGGDRGQCGMGDVPTRGFQLLYVKGSREESLEGGYGAFDGCVGSRDHSALCWGLDIGNIWIIVANFMCDEKLTLQEGSGLNRGYWPVSLCHYY